MVTTEKLAMAFSFKAMAFLADESGILLLVRCQMDTAATESL